jgi:capsular polysaccharide biosynthesis protein
MKLQLLRSQYTSLVQTDLIAGPVSRQLHLPEAQIEGDLTATADPLSFTINILATASSPSSSSLIAQAATAQLISYVAKSQAHLGITPTARVVLTELTAPHNGIRGPLSTSKMVLSGAVAFLVVGGGFLIIADLLRRRG